MKLEKLITDLSNYWDLDPEKVVDRLNHMNESEINKIVNKMTKKFKNGGPLPSKFENGGIMKCLKGGKPYSECMKCGGKTLKAEDGEKLPYARPGWFRSTFRRFSNVPEYPRHDGNGTFSGEIVGSDTLHVVNGPYTTFTEKRTPEGRYIDDTTGGRYYVPGSKSKGFMRTVAPEDLVKMFDNVRDRFESTPSKRTGGKVEKSEKFVNHKEE